MGLHHSAKMFLYNVDFAEIELPIDRLVAAGAEGIVFGCTEISLLLAPDSVHVPCFDTTSPHADQAVEFAVR